MFCAVTIAMAATASTVTPAMCGEAMTVSSVRQVVVHRRRFLFENVEPRARYLAGLQGGIQGRFIDDATTRGIDDERALFHAAETGRIEQDQSFRDF